MIPTRTNADEFIRATIWELRRNIECSEGAIRGNKVRPFVEHNCLDFLLREARRDDGLLNNILVTAAESAFTTPNKNEKLFASVKGLRKLKSGKGTVDDAVWHRLLAHFYDYMVMRVEKSLTV